MSMTSLGNIWYYNTKHGWLRDAGGNKVYNSPDYNYVVNLDAPLFTKGNHSIGIGGLFYHQLPSNNRIDYEEHNEVRLNMSYGYQIKGSCIRAGISLDQMQDKISYNFNLPLGVFAATGYSRNIGAGIMLGNIKKGLYIGVSSNYLISHRMTKENIVYKSYQPNFCLLAGTDLKLSKKWIGQPSFIMMRYGYSQVNFCIIYKKKLTVGTGYSINDDSWPIILGYALGRFSFRYSNTTYISILPNEFMTTAKHTLGLKYTFNQRADK